MGVTAEGDGKIACRICGERVHVIQSHLKERHPEVTVAEYRADYPEAPMLSATATRTLEEQRRMKAGPAETPQTAASLDDAMSMVMEKRPFHEVFKLGLGEVAKTQMIPTFRVGAGLAPYVPDQDPHYVFDLAQLKICMMALTVNIPAYLWGHAGTGKSTMWEQIAAFTGWPTFRIQHTRNTEESHIIGEKTVEDGNVRFVLGPLAYAMKHGLLYVADEYDFAMPSVLALYQPVLEGKPLIIKEADEENRVIRPHKNFRFVATGNTNGQGDETGLYQGTLLQNAANYERFGTVMEVKYMPAEIEAAMLINKAKIQKDVAEKLVEFARTCRAAFADQKIGLPPSPRAMLNAAIQGRMLGDRPKGIWLGYINRLNRTDQVAVEELLRRVRF